MQSHKAIFLACHLERSEVPAERSRENLAFLTCPRFAIFANWDSTKPGERRHLAAFVVSASRAHPATCPHADRATTRVGTGALSCSSRAQLGSFLLCSLCTT